MFVFFILLTLFWLAIGVWHAIDLLQFLQLNEYLSGRFLRWSGRHVRRAVYPWEALALLPLVAGLALPDLAGSWLLPGIALLVWLAAAVYGFRRWRDEQKRAIKPLVYTGRVQRLLFGLAIVLIAEGLAALGGASRLAGSLFSPRQPLSGMALVFFSIFLWISAEIAVANVVLANLLIWPVEEGLRQYYVASARRIIRRINPVVIGITGSYGKTSTKEILAHLLGSKYPVLKTPRTFNTIMGVCKVIREDLQPQHRYFIVEMGAYKSGEIARICRLVRPQIAILTAIGPQHLERFKTIENVARAKNELIEALPADGIAIFNGDDPLCRRMAGQAHIKTLLYGVDTGSEGPTLRAENAETSDQGTTFDLVMTGQQRLTTRSRLLGRHNVLNTLGAVLAAQQCGVSLRESVHALASLAPVEHRLQAIRAGGGILTIDDAYSANPAGAKAALEVLASFKSGRRVLVTPGYAELGSIQAAEHARLGELAAASCDLIVLIGAPERREEILKGVRAQGFDESKVYCYNRLNDARAMLRETLLSGDVVLFENDLPDTY